MSQPIEDYAMIGDTQTAALVGRDGSIDWLCVPRFDSGSCFSALLGDPSHGRWLLTVDGAETSRVRRYVGGSLVLETEIATEAGRVRITDFMPPRLHHPHVARLVEGLEGRVPMRMELVIRFEYGSDVPWVRRTHRGLHAVAGPDGLTLDTPVDLRGHHLLTEASFEVGAGESVPFVLSWHRSHRGQPAQLDVPKSLEATIAFWRTWESSLQVPDCPWADDVVRSLVALKGLTYEPTGGIVAAATTSLPESIGGERNWDYRYCWVRDASLTLDALLESGCRSEAQAWLRWLVRAAAGAPDQLQIMYGPGGERRLTEFVLDWLPGYDSSVPVRVGNAASGQFQLDVYGEMMDAIDRARRHGIELSDVVWDFQLAVMAFVTEHWADPDDGIWEIRGERQHFTHSRVMAWVAFDRAIAAVERHGLDGPVDEWREARDAVHTEVCEQGFSTTTGAFTQYYGSDELDASVLMIPLVGFLPADDERVRSTIDAVQRELLADGFVLRYRATSGVDGLSGTEGVFLPCSFWLVDCLALLGRLEEATQLFDRLLAVGNDLGLFSEEFDPAAGRMVGNFPQAFTHVGLVNSARNLADATARAAWGDPAT